MCQKQKYAPSVFEKYVTTISLGGKEIKLNLYDTAGKTLYQKSPPCSNKCESFFCSYQCCTFDSMWKEVSDPADLSDHTPNGI